MSRSQLPPHPGLLAAAKQQQIQVGDRLARLRKRASDALERADSGSLAEATDDYLRLTARAVWLGSDALEVSEINQETLIKASMGLPGFAPTSDDVGRDYFAWVRRIRKNVVFDALRSLGRRAGAAWTPAQDDDGPDPLEGIADGAPCEDHSEVLDLIQSVLEDEEDRRLLALRLAELSHREIAQRLGRGESAVRSQWSRLCAELRDNTRLQRAVEAARA